MGHLLIFDQKFCDFLGYTPEELQKISIQEITHGDDLSSDVTYAAKLLSGEVNSFTLDKRYIHKNGESKWVRGTSSLFRDENRKPLYYLMKAEALNDQSAHKGHTNVAFEHNNFFELSSELMAIVDSKGYLRKLNTAFKNHFGYSESELMAKPFISFMHPEDYEKAEYLKEKLQKHTHIANFETRFICKDGRVTDLSWTATYVPEFQSTYAIARDITALRKQEMIIAEHKLSIINNSKMNALGRMASGIAHEINNPLTIVYGQMSILKRLAEKDQLDAAKITQSCDSVMKMCQRIVDIISGLRTFSRDGSKDVFEYESLKKIVDETIAFCQGEMKTHHIEMTMQKIPEDLKIYGRSTQISQVLLNLLNNAKDALENVEGKYIEVELINTDNEIGLAVVDSGPGIKPENTEQLFQPFFTTKEVGKGTGLGLSISKGIIDAHGGKLYLDTKSKKTRFVFVVPKK